MVPLSEPCRVAHPELLPLEATEPSYLAWDCLVDPNREILQSEPPARRHVTASKSSGIALKKGNVEQLDACLVPVRRGAF